MPFDIAVDEARSVVLVSFREGVTERDFTALDGLGRDRFAGKQYDVVFDLSRAQAIDLATDFVAKRAERPQLYLDRQRIYVVPNDDLKLLTKLYAAYQEAKGWRAPLIVRTLARKRSTASA
jgi:hypothetical protein